MRENKVKGVSLLKTGRSGFGQLGHGVLDLFKEFLLWRIQKIEREGRWRDKKTVNQEFVG